jgi:ATP-dependent Lon protease
MYYDTTNDPPGFQTHLIEDPDGLSPRCTLYLPSKLASKLRESKEQALLELERKSCDEKAPPPHVATRTPRPAPDRLDVDAERAKVCPVDTQHCRGSHYPVYDDYEPVNMLARSRTLSDKRDQERMETLYKQLVQKVGSLRKIGWPSLIGPDLDALAQRLPHFASVVRFVKDRLQSARERDLIPRVPPILLTGDPGLGKTHFCKALAEVLQTTVRVQPFDNAETTSQLLGSDRHWGNTHHGILFDLLALGTHANPIVILDELDKARSPRGDMDPLAPLHSILERTTACALRDLSLEFTLDATLVTFIATANDKQRIPQSLLSRFRMFEIQQPTGADAITVTHEVLGAVLERFGLEVPANSRKIAASLAHLNPREAGHFAEEVIAMTLASGCHALRLEDFTQDCGDSEAKWLH